MPADDCSGVTNHQTARASYRTVFISDTHLGTKGCNARLLADFLKSFDSEFLYGVGDIVDGWSLRKAWYWDHDHDRVVRRIIKKAKNGTEVVYVPGNHDEALRPWAALSIDIAGIRIVKQAVHVTADGKRLLILHGDQFDGVIRYAKWLAYVGDWAYGRALWVNYWFNVARRRLGFSYWSVSKWAKHQVKSAVKFIDDFENAVAHEAKRRNLDGVVCGHIHSACMRDIDGVHYLNCGDWVESCTALVEHHDGRLEIIDWGALSTVHQATGDGTETEDEMPQEHGDRIPVLAARGAFAHLGLMSA